MYRYYVRSYTYQILTPPTELAVTLAEVKTHLRLDLTDISQDTYLTLLIQSATNIAELYTKRTFINTEFRTYRDFFCSCIQLRRSRLQTLNAFQYLKNGSFVDVDIALYYITNENNFSKIMLNDGESYPTNIDDRIQSIIIDFIAGYGPNSTFIPSDLKLALLNHIAALYEDRGDCNLLIDAESALPATSKATYDKNRIWDIHNGYV